MKFEEVAGGSPLPMGPEPPVDSPKDSGRSRATAIQFRAIQSDCSMIRTSAARFRAIPTCTRRGTSTAHCRPT
eukprot:7425094-Pyramimonas_sp.AAC.1